MPAVERAVFDFGARVIGHDLAAADAAADEYAFARESIAELAPAGGDQVRRPAIERRGEFAGRHARAIDDRLVIAGEESGCIAELVDMKRTEILLEEFLCAIIVKRNGRLRTVADIAQRCCDCC